MLPIVINILLVIHVLVSLLIILLVLMQRPKNEGLGAAFGGGATDQLFGAQTTNVLQTITRWLGGMFFALTLLLSILYVRQGGGRSPIQEKLSAKTVIPEPEPAPATPVPAVGDMPSLEGKEPIKLELTPGKAAEAVTDPIKPFEPAPEAGAPEKLMKLDAPAAGEQKPAEEKALEKPAPAPAPEKPVPAAPPIQPPAENKSALPEPAPEPKPAEPAK